MMAVRHLVEEHEIIGRFLTQLDEAAGRILRGEGPPRSFFDEALTFGRTFADQAHHYKEEYVLFGLLAQRHDGAIDGEIERHRAQHENCRNLLSEISAALAGYERGAESSTRQLHRALSDYVSTLRSHIRSEDEIFFPMVEDVLTEEEDRRLVEEFRQYESRVDEDLPASAEERLARMQALSGS